MSQKKSYLSIVWIALITIAAGTLLIILSNASPLEAYQMFFKGIFGNMSNFCEIFVKATPLILTGLGCAVAFKTGFFNIGAEGQFYMGAVAAASVALGLTSVPGPARIILSMLAGFLCGGLWALIAAVFKAKFGISEIIVTIMLNYISINFMGIAVRTFLMDPAGSVPQSARIEASAAFKLLMPPTRLNMGFLIAIAAVVIVWILMEKTTVGYELKVVGSNRRAAKCSGISVMKNTIISAFLSGGLAGLAGVVEVLGIQKKLLEGISSDCGYTAVLVALLASNHPVGVFFSAVGFAAMQVGANSMQRQMGVPSAIVNILVGLVVLLVLGKKMFQLKKKK
ncbi:ABC transporter permease [Clostridium sp. AM58-1XD]|uniref:ABC transporter permease n=1 Tax=Clostridium sp. AM58-1XD TaxID=2292307 RepID=UPI000E477024|nr:ABC transporter permease [Clostridium sp. AM58-1XD]RGY98071.1 ABC transporter permease [Clostridium sp. AM58-1XD]